jgi:CRISPR-associated protein Cas5d
VISFRVSGDYACFSRPEFKVERVSYPIITPSAARGVAEAIFWRPEIRYEIRRIGIIKMGGTTVIVRNEIEDRQGGSPIVVEDKRQQRSSLILKDVEYLIEADIVLRPHATDPVAKYSSQFERRLARGQHFHSPYLGTREFPAQVEEAGDRTPPGSDLRIGTILFDLAFVPSSTRADLSFRRPGSAEPVRGYAHAIFLENAHVSGGWLDVPARKYQELYRLEAGNV